MRRTATPAATPARVQAGTGDPAGAPWPSRATCIRGTSDHLDHDHRCAKHARTAQRSARPTLTVSAASGAPIRALRPLPLRRVSGRQIDALTMMLHLWVFARPYQRLTRDSGRARGARSRDRIPSREFRGDGKHLPPLSHRRGVILSVIRGNTVHARAWEDNHLVREIR